MNRILNRFAQMTLLAVAAWGASQAVAATEMAASGVVASGASAVTPGVKGSVKRHAPMAMKAPVAASSASVVAPATVAQPASPAVAASEPVKARKINIKVSPVHAMPVTKGEVKAEPATVVAPVASAASATVGEHKAHAAGKTTHKTEVKAGERKVGVHKAKGLKRHARGQRKA